MIDRLLERDEFADYWSMKWGDVLRIKAEFPVNLWPNAAQAYHRWVRASIAANKPYDKFVREMLTSSGSNFRNDNPPSNPKLLAYLEKEFIASGYDLKHLYRLILTSNTYQISSVPRFKGPEAEANFASYQLRRLEAEVLIDAVNKITGTSDLYTSAIPEPYTYIPHDMSAVAIADGSISSSFLTLFGRSARATGMATERINRPVPAQWLHMRKP